MKRRSNAPQELRPIYARPTFDRRELVARRAWCRAAYSGERRRPKQGEFDPLELRLGMRVQLIDARAGWVISNPLYDSLLRSSPEIDPSIAGPGWLREVYRWHKARGLVTLPRVSYVIEKRLSTRRAAQEFTAQPIPPAVAHTPTQQTMFDTDEVAA